MDRYSFTDPGVVQGWVGLEPPIPHRPHARTPAWPKAWTETITGACVVVPPPRLSTVGDRAFPAATSRNSHVTSAPFLHTFRKRGCWRRFCSAAIYRPN